MEKDAVRGWQSFNFSNAARSLRRQALVVYPTDTVFGLGCHPLSGSAVARLCALKGRLVTKGLVLVAPSYRLLEDYVDFPAAEWPKQIKNSWPGAVTWVVPAKSQVPDYLTGGRRTIAVRLCLHPVVKGLCYHLKSSLVSTSANPSGRPPARNLFVARRYFGAAVDCYLNGALDQNAMASEIREFPSGKVLRSQPRREPS
ncbi:MAG TPA: tRNA threonylcarbamoyladenosine biosynthesis protein RimN [Gammaproteobacteria bacterium]|nr:tRNA threonylcarbamoyladenosine biosynthesis protein RimN [Gammaproteobacteria bacterium]